MITKDQVIQALRTITDLEIPVNIWDLGLIYDVSIDSDKELIRIQMTLTRPDSPGKDTLPIKIHDILLKEIKAKGVEIELTFEPIWTPDRLTEEGKRRLGIED